MDSRALAVLVCALGVPTRSANGGAQGDEGSAAPTKLLLSGAVVHTMVAGAEPRPLDVLIEGDRILAVGEELALPTGAVRVDFTGRHVIPGLIDGMANHDPDQDALYVASGVTLIRDNGNERGRILLERQRAQRERVPGPDLFIAGLILDGFPPATNESVVLRDEVAAAALLPRVLEDEPDFLSVHRGIPVGAWRRAIQAAHDAGIELWGYLPREVVLEDALAAHMDGLFGLDAFLPADANWDRVEVDALAARITAAAEADLEVTPLLNATAVTLQDFDGEPAVLSALSPHYLPLWRARIDEIRASPAELRERLTVALARQSELLVRLDRAGVRLVPGSGAPNALLAPGEGLIDELLLWVRAGLAPAHVLQLATAGAAEALGLAGRRGTIAAGAMADLVVLAGDPREDLTHLRRPELVVLRGRQLDRAALDERVSALRTAQAERLAALAEPLDVPLPDLPQGDIVFQARYETRALGLRTASEHLAVVKEHDGATSFCTRVRASGGTAGDSTEVELSQRFRDGVLQDFALTVRGGGQEVTTKGLLIGSLLQVERRCDGIFLDNQRAHRRLELVDIGSALTDILIAQHWKEGAHGTLYFEGMNPVESEWRLQIAGDDHRFLVATGQGPLVSGFDAQGAPLFSFRRAGNTHSELVRLDVQTFGGPGLALPPERVFVHPSEPAPAADGDGGGR